MEFTKNNKAGYTQVIISFLIIFCTFLPFIEVTYGNDYYHFEKTTSAMLEFTTFLVADKKTYIGYLFVLFFMLQLANIFVQSHKGNRFISLVAGVVGGISLILLHNQVKETENNLGNKLNYQWGFYLLLILIAAQIVHKLITNQELSEETATNEDVNELFEQAESEKKEYTQTVAETERKTADAVVAEVVQEVAVAPAVTVEAMTEEPIEDSELEALKAEAEKLKAIQAMLKAEEEAKQKLAKEKLEKEQLEDEYRRLKAQAEQIEQQKREKERLEKERLEKERQERERIEQERLEKERIEKEKIEKERQEKENLMNEIAKLKEILKNESNS